MALRLSTGLRNKMIGLEASVAFHQGAGDNAELKDTNPDTIIRTAGSWLTDGFFPGMVLKLAGCTTGANNAAITDKKVAAVVALTLTLETAAVVSVAEVFAAATVLCAGNGGSLCEIMRSGCLFVYSGGMPSDADQAITGTQLIKVTVGSGAFAHGAPANGLDFDAEASGYIEKCSEQVWSGVGLASGTAGYFVFVANPTDNLGASITLPRLMGTVGTSGADLNFATTSISIGGTVTIDTFKLTLPAYYGA